MQTKVCRVCLKDDESEEMISAFGEIIFQIFLVSQIKIIEYIDQMPALVCQQCHTDLLNAVRFREKCRSSENYFRKRTSHLETEFLKKILCEEQKIENFYDMSIVKEEENIDEYLQKTRNWYGLIIKEEDENIDNLQEVLNESFRCQNCNKVFKTKKYLNRHVKRFHEKEKVQKKKKLKEKVQKKKKLKKKGLKCRYCSRYLTSKHSLSDHIKVKHEFINATDRFLCDLCGKDFPLKYYLLRHFKTSHLKINSYKRKESQSLPCSICGRFLKNKGNLSTHEKSHRILSPEDYWYCDLCGNKFKGRGEMTVHIKRQHLYKIRYPCNACPDKSWRTLFQLQRHIKVFHCNIREFKCERCGKGFGEKNKLAAHVRIHTGEQPFQCLYCERKFTHQTDLRRHTWGHTGVRPYKCGEETCGKGFMKRYELKAHEKKCHNKATFQNI